MKACAKSVGCKELIRLVKSGPSKLIEKFSSANQNSLNDILFMADAEALATIRKTLSTKPSERYSGTLADRLSAT